MDIPWIIFGKSLDNLWIIHGLSMDKKYTGKTYVLYNSNFFEKKNLYTKSSNKRTMFQKQKYMEKTQKNKKS